MAAVAKSQKFTRANPCPICDGCESDPRGQERRCAGFMSTDGAYAHCCREERAGEIEPTSANPPTFPHIMHGDCRCGTSHGPAREQAFDGEYNYQDEHGVLLFQVVRKPGKKFLQRRPDGAGGWEWKLDGVRRVPYRLPALLAADPERTIYVVEGEKDVHALESIGEIATTTAQGAMSWRHSADEMARALKGRRVVIIRDKDENGAKYAKAAAATLKLVASSVTILECPQHKDISDHLEAGGKLSQLVPMPGVATEPANVTREPWEDGPPEGFGEAGEGNEGDRPEIVLSTNLESNVDDAIRALRSDPNLYQRTGSLVHVTQATPEEVADERSPIAPDSPVIHVMASATLLERLASCASWMRLDARSKKPTLRPTLPSKAVTSAVHARKEWRGIRRIVGVITTPTMRPGGTIVQEPGHDAGTRYLYAPNADFEPVRDKPTKGEAMSALERLSDLFCDFPFETDAARMVPIAAILTLVARPAIVGPVPCFGFDTPTRGTGKGLVVSAITMLATGQTAAVATFPSSERNGQEELEKMLGAYALAGVPLVFFDNVPIGVAFGGAPLEKVLTAPDTVSLRILGRTETPTLPWRALIFVSGNNLTIADETARRVLVARMVSDRERPEERTGFKYSDLVAHIREHRAALVVDALTILRAYTANGSPDDGGLVLGSFEAWSRLVPAAIRFAGGADVLGARVTLTSDSDIGAATHATFLARLPALVGEEGLSTSAILDALYPAPGPGEPPDGYEELRDAIASATDSRPGQRPPAAKLGVYFRGIRDRRVGGRVLKALASHAGAQRWGVR